jgi:hypothetical protein
MQPPDWDGWGVGEHEPRVVWGLTAGGPFAVFIAKGMTAVKTLGLGPQRRFERDSGGSTNLNFGGGGPEGARDFDKKKKGFGLPAEGSPRLGRAGLTSRS